MTFIYNSPLNFNIPKLSFRSNSAVYNPSGARAKDTFSTNPLYEQIGAVQQIEAEVNSNSRISELLKQYNLPVKVNSKELEKLQKGHLKDTRITAARIYSSLPSELKSQVNLSDLHTAAMFHDYGKILIPDSILNKKGELTDKEREIMQLHSELGYELLKNKGLNENTLNLIKYHHQNPSGTGYPAVNNNFEYGLEEEIMNTADKYAALREKRSYKDAMSQAEALSIISEDVQKGLISADVFNALVKGENLNSGIK